MNHQRASPDGMSTQSWGTSAPSSYLASPKQVSSASSWGTVASKSPVGASSPVSFGPLGSISTGSSWDSDSTLVNSPGGSWPSSPSGTYVGSSASSTTLVSPVVPVGGQGLPHLGRSGRSLISLNPALQDGRLAFNFANPPPPPSPSERHIYGICHSSAFSPSMSYAQINFDGFPLWVISIELPQALTVFMILQHIYQYLQEPDMQGTQNMHSTARNHLQMMYSRDSNPSVPSYTGKKRIAFLGSRTLFAGLSPTPGGNCWTVYFARASH